MSYLQIFCCNVLVYLAGILCVHLNKTVVDTEDVYCIVVKSEPYTTSRADGFKQTKKCTFVNVEIVDKNPVSGAYLEAKKLSEGVE